MVTDGQQDNNAPRTKPLPGWVNVILRVIAWVLSAIRHPVTSARLIVGYLNTRRQVKIAWRDYWKYLGALRELRDVVGAEAAEDIRLCALYAAKFNDLESKHVAGLLRRAAEEARDYGGSCVELVKGQVCRYAEHMARAQGKPPFGKVGVGDG